MYWTGPLCVPAPPHSSFYRRIRFKDTGGCRDIGNRVPTGTGTLVVRFVRVIRVPACARARVSRVLCVSRLPPVSFYRYLDLGLSRSWSSATPVFLWKSA